jgi:putative DNA primase/helicase
MVADHPYARRKRIAHAFGARRGIASGRVVGYNADCILVPNRNWDGEFIGVECINPGGKKQTFGNKGILILGTPEDAPLIHLCEGWATAYALSEMFPQRFATIVCFGKQIEKAIPEITKRYSGRPVIHEESPKNRDAWDIWHAGDGDTYTKNVVGALS